MTPTLPRRQFLSWAAAVSVTAGLRAEAKVKADFKISLAEWSLNRGIFGKGNAERFDHLDFCKIARSLGIDGVEYVNQMFIDKAKDSAYLAEMKMRQEGEGVQGLLIMCDREGNLGDPNDTGRTRAVENHYKWLDAAVTLGCHSIRVNAASDPALTWNEQKELAADGLHRLALAGAERGIDVVVENHGGLSSHGKWLTEVMAAADHPRVGILPDFGNFYIDRARGELYNPYQGLWDFMPWVKQAVSAKAYDWDTGAGALYTEDRREGREMTLDYARLIGIVLQAGYQGFIGIEYEGEKHSEIEGIRRTKQALEEARALFA